MGENHSDLELSKLSLYLYHVFLNYLLGLGLMNIYKTNKK
nr:hypothetical protein [Vibrio sp. FF_304]